MKERTYRRLRARQKKYPPPRSAVLALPRPQAKKSNPVQDGKVRVDLWQVMGRLKPHLKPLSPRSRLAVEEEIRRVLHRRTPTTNAFCPTGEGGGIDPTCSPSGSGGGRTLDHVEADLKAAIKAKNQMAIKRLADEYREVNRSLVRQRSAKEASAKTAPRSKELERLDTAADKAGHALFDRHRSGYVNDRATRIERVNLSKHRKDEEAENGERQLDEYEHVFFPSTGKGLDVAGYGWGDATKEWTDVDGKIYTKWGDTITVVTVDRPLKTKGQINKELRASRAAAKVRARTPGITKPDPTRKVGKFYYGQEVEYKSPSGMTRRLQVEKYEGGKYHLAGPGGTGALAKPRHVRPVANAAPAARAQARVLHDLSDRYTLAEAREILRAVREGYVNRKDVLWVAGEIERRVGLGFEDAYRLAVTETTRMGASDVLNELVKKSKKDGVARTVLFISSEESCPQCTELHGDEYTLEEANDVIPVHPNCTCRWEPWAGADDEDTEFAANVFCPTGEGGGIDPTCSPPRGSRGPALKGPGIVITKQEREELTPQERKELFGAGKKRTELNKKIKGGTATEEEKSEAAALKKREEEIRAAVRVRLKGKGVAPPKPEPKKEEPKKDDGRGVPPRKEGRTGEAPMPPRKDRSDVTGEFEWKRDRSSAGRLFYSAEERSKSGFARRSIEEYDKRTAAHSEELDRVWAAVSGDAEKISALRARIGELEDRATSLYHDYSTGRIDNYGEVTKATNAASELRKELIALRDESRKRVWGQIGESAREFGPVARSINAQRQAGLKEEVLVNLSKVEGQLEGNVAADIGDQLGNTEVHRLGGNRSYFTGRRHHVEHDGIHLSNNTRGNSVECIAHELGHSIESDIRVHSLAVGFMEKRTAGEPPKWMGAGYARDEMGRKDDWEKTFGSDHAPYVGKHYDSADTEVISMGLELMFNDPVRFAEKDPEYFKLMTGILTGRLLK